NHRIRKISPAGVITSIAGASVDHTAGTFDGDGGPATLASFDRPTDVVVDSKGNIYIADSGNSRIRKIGIDGIVSTFAGNGDYGYSEGGGFAKSAMLSTVYGLAVDGQDNIYIADTL